MLDLILLVLIVGVVLSVVMIFARLVFGLLAMIIALAFAGVSWTLAGLFKWLRGGKE